MQSIIHLKAKAARCPNIHLRFQVRQLSNAQTSQTWVLNSAIITSVSRHSRQVMALLIEASYNTLCQGPSPEIMSSHMNSILLTIMDYPLFGGTYH
jgi:hypothetical protein